MDSVAPAFRTGHLISCFFIPRPTDRRRRPRSRSCKGVHLPGDGLVQAPAVVTHEVEVEVTAPFNVAEIGLGTERLHRRFQAVRSTVEIKRIRRSNGQVDLAVEITPQLRPMAAEVLGHIVTLLPIGNHGRSHRACRALEYLDRTPIAVAWREGPLERGHLTAILPDHDFPAREILD